MIDSVKGRILMWFVPFSFFVVDVWTAHNTLCENMLIVKQKVKKRVDEKWNRFTFVIEFNKKTIIYFLITLFRIINEYLCWQSEL